MGTTRGQYKRGMKLESNQVLVARPSRFGNPWRIRKYGGEYEVFDITGTMSYCLTKYKAHEFAVYLYRLRVLPGLLLELESLRGKQLMCDCDLELPCHADVICEYLNKGGDSE